MTTPATVTISAVVVLAVAVHARNAPGLLIEDSDAQLVAPLYAFRVACLQMSTIAGLVIASACAATLAGYGSRTRCEELLAILEPNAARRWFLRVLSVLLVLLAAIGLTTLATFGAGFVQAVRLGRGVRLANGDWGGAFATFAQAITVGAAFAAVAVLVGSLLRANPPIAAALTVGAAQALLFLQHLLGGLGDVIIPTAWIGRWLHLPARDYGVGYLWTTGAFANHQAAAGLAVATLAAAASVAGLLTVARGARS